MARLGRIVASLPISLVTLYKSPLITRDTLTIAISQSGQSPDVVLPMRYFREGGATTVALVNDAKSPLAEQAEWCLPLHAGPELSVAATKSFICSLTASARWHTPLLTQAHTSIYSNKTSGFQYIEMPDMKQKTRVSATRIAGFCTVLHFLKQGCDRHARGFDFFRL